MPDEPLRGVAIRLAARLATQAGMARADAAPQRRGAMEEGRNAGMAMIDGPIRAILDFYKRPFTGTIYPVVRGMSCGQRIRWAVSGDEQGGQVVFDDDEHPMRLLCDKCTERFAQALRQADAI